jgi:uncharacterized protein YbcV (DUF1398 family)
MFAPKNIEAVLAQAAREKWTYPRMFDALKEAGVSHYDVTVATHAIRYFGQGGSWQPPVPEGWVALPVGETLDKPAFLAALRRTQTGQTDYSTFLREIAAAGCSHYRVDMPARTVTYTSDHGDSVVEPVPPGAEKQK